MKLSRTGIENIIFDFGGVLFEIDYFAPVREFEKLGFGTFQEIYSQAQQNEVFDKFETGDISSEDFIGFLRSKCPGVLDEKLLHAWNSILIGLMSEQTEKVRSIRASGIRTFIFSNTNAIHVSVFEKMIDLDYGLSKFKSHFEKVIYSNELGMKKPYPASFIKVCGNYGLSPVNTLFIDDSLQHVEGALKAGLQAYHLKPGETISELLSEF